jgi:hypothetical protein
MTIAEKYAYRMAQGATVTPDAYEYEEAFIDAMCDADFRRSWGNTADYVTLKELLDIHAEAANAVNVPMWHELKTKVTP